MRLKHKIIMPLFLTVSLASCGGENGGDLPDSEAPEWGNPQDRIHERLMDCLVLALFPDLIWGKEPLVSVFTRGFSG